MKEISQATVLVYDNGLFQPVAHRLAKDFKRVLYFTPWEKGFSLINDAVLGDGFPDIERVYDIWDVKKEVDAWVFPDIGHSGLQLELESQGFPVWGCRDGDEQELDRRLFLRTLKECGLAVPEFEVVNGLNALRTYLEDKQDCYIKVSRYRGSFETSHFRSMDLDNGLLDLWAVKFGAVKELIRFLVFANIDTPLEIGADTYCIDGKWPDTMLHGIEWKDRSYLASVTGREDMPKQIQEVMECFGPVLAKSRYRGFFSMEIRVKDDVGYFIDPTCRGGLPSTGSQIALWENYSEIIWAGAHGELLNPVPAAKFSAESIITLKGDKTAWRVSEIPESLQGHLMITGCCLVDGKVAFPPGHDQEDEIGWLVATGDTQVDVIENQNALADDLPDGMDANTETLAYVLKEIHQAAEQGVEFSKEPTPPPEIVVQ